MISDERNLFQKTLKQIIERKERLEKGGINSIPFPFPALNKYVPGIMPETQIGLTTVSGAGKSLFATNIYVQHPFNFWLENRNKMDIDIKINFFCLEDSKDLTMKRMIIRALYEQLGIRVPMFKINSYFQEDKLDDDTLRAIDSLDPYFELFLSKVEFIDDIATPGQIHFKIKEWLERPENGEIVDEQGHPISKKDRKDAMDSQKYLKTFYRSKHSNRFVINIIDNMQNVEPGKDDGSKWNALDLLCRKYLRNSLCNKYGCTNLIIAQQEKSKEKTQYTGDGDIVASKYLPSKDAISEYKNVTDTCHVLFGLFYPHMYGIETYPEKGEYYNIKRLEDFYRNLHILKSNFAEPNLNTNLLFDGVTGIISELPPARDKDAMDQVYKYVEDMINLKKGIKPLKIK